MVEKNIDAFRTISEVAEDLDLPQHVLRFWETRFPQIKPMKRGGGRRYYRPEDVELLRAIRQLLYGEGYTIKGVQRILKEQGPRAVAAAVGAGGAAPQPRAMRAAEPDEDIDDESPGEYADEDIALRPSPVAAVRPAPAAPPPVTPPPVAPRQAAPAVPAKPAPTVAPPTPPASTGSSGNLGDMDLRRLRAALADLTECERILAAARRV